MKVVTAYQETAVSHTQNVAVENLILECIRRETSGRDGEGLSALCEISHGMQFMALVTQIEEISVQSR